MNKNLSWQDNWYPVP